jgi:hypothetical protein
MKDVIVTGGRDYNDYDTIQKVLNLFDIGLLIQGGALGADKQAQEYAKHNGIECVTVIADWNKHGRAAGPIRNREMLLKYPNAIVVAFPGGAGTANCIKTAIQLNHTVLQVHK